MNTQTAVTTAIVAGSLALQVDGLVYWIGPAGCVILVPALVLVLLLPLLGESGGIVPVRSRSARTDAPTPASIPALCSNEHSIEPDYLPNPNTPPGLRLPARVQGFRGWIDAAWPSRPASNPALLDRAEKIKITEKIQPNGTRERSVLIVYRKPSH